MVRKDEIITMIESKFDDLKNAETAINHFKLMSMETIDARYVCV